MANAIWPDVNTLESSKQACRNAAGAAFIVAALTAIVAVIAMTSGTAIVGINGWALVDAVAFAVLGIFLRRFSRTAALIALVLYILERVAMMADSPSPAGIPLAIIFVLFFLGGVRGAFAYHRLNAEQSAQANAAGGTIG